MLLLFYGDSNTFGYDPRSYLGGRYGASVRWPERLTAALGDGHQLINDGMNGRCIPPAGTPLPPADLTVVMLGSNDLLMGASAEDASARLAGFIKPNLPRRLLLLAPPQMERGAWVESDDLILEARRYNLYLRALASELNCAFADASALRPPLAFDGVHLLPEGHEALYEGLLPVVSALVFPA